MSEEELLALASEAPVIVQEEITPAAKFAYEMNLKHGDERISALLVFDLYRTWKGPRPQSRYRFFKDFNKLFQSIRMKDGMYYLLNPEPFDLTKAHFFQVKAELRRERTDKKREAKKKQSQKSGSN